MPAAPRDTALLRQCEREIPKWLELWGCPELATRLVVKPSARLRTTLARCAPHGGEIRIAAFLLDAPAPLLREVLCHEVAHAAVHALHGGRRVRPHGAEWKELMRAAGFVARARMPGAVLEALPAWRVHRAGRVVWEHRCAKCHAVRVAGRPVKEWRCGNCRFFGFGGRLEIRRVEGSIGASALQRTVAGE